MQKRFKTYKRLSEQSEKSINEQIRSNMVEILQSECMDRLQNQAKWERKPKNVALQT